MALKVFLGLFVTLSVTVGVRLQYQTDCVKIIKDNKFPFGFFPEGLEREESVWENVVRKIANVTTNCLKAIKEDKRPCDHGPRMKITFPVISQNPTIPLKVLPRPYLATKENPTNAASQILSAWAQIWKLFVFSLMAAAISGIIIWFLVSINKSLYVIIISRKTGQKAEKPRVLICPSKNSDGVNFRSCKSHSYFYIYIAILMTNGVLMAK